MPTNEDTDHNQHYQRLWKKYNFAFEMKNNLRKNSTFEQFIIDNLASGKAKKSTAAVLHLLHSHSLPTTIPYLLLTSDGFG